MRIIAELSHIFCHSWGRWEYYVIRNHWTLLGTLSEVTFRKRKCTFCGQEQEEFYDYGDNIPILRD